MPKVTTGWSLDHTSTFSGACTSCVRGSFCCCCCQTKLYNVGDKTCLYPGLMCLAQEQTGCYQRSVIGGKSSSQNFYNHGTGTQVFSGNVSTRNNGGFCSSWLSIHPSIDLSRYDGIYIDAVAPKQQPLV